MKKTLVFPVLLVIIILVFIGLFIWSSYLQGNSFNEGQDNGSFEINGTKEEIEGIKQECVNLGCEEGSVYVGSIESDKFYKCTCGWAKQVSTENLICFKTREEAIDDGRIESEC